MSAIGKHDISQTWNLVDNHLSQRLAHDGEWTYNNLGEEEVTQTNIQH